MIVGMYKNAQTEISIKNRVYNYYFENLVKANKKETKNILIDEKNYKDLAIYFTRYVRIKSIKMFSLYYHELMGKIKEHERKKYLMVDDYVLDILLDRIKEIISIEKVDGPKLLVDTDDKLPGDIALKNVVILMTCVTKPCLNNIASRKFNVKSCGYDKMYMGKGLIEDKLYQSAHQFNERRINHRDFYSTLLMVNIRISEQFWLI